MAVLSWICSFCSMKISATSEICKGRTSSPMFFIVLGRWGMVNLACTQKEYWPFCFRVTLLLFVSSGGCSWSIWGDSENTFVYLSSCNNLGIFLWLGVLPGQRPVARGNQWLKASSLWCHLLEPFLMIPYESSDLIWLFLPPSNTHLTSLNLLFFITATAFFKFSQLYL